jgi:hypothetical protein
MKAFGVRTMLSDGSLAMVLIDAENPLDAAQKVKKKISGCAIDPRQKSLTPQQYENLNSGASVVQQAARQLATFVGDPVVAQGTQAIDLRGK